MGVYGSILEKADKIIERLDTLDVLCESKNIEAELVILGGSGILLFMEMYKRPFRPTRDVDVNILSSTNEVELQKLIREAQIDIVGGVLQLPPMEDIRDGEKFEIEAGFRAIKVYVPSIELLACTKLFSTREKDLIDLKETSILEICDKTKLNEMICEYEANMLNPKDSNINLYELKSSLFR